MFKRQDTYLPKCSESKKEPTWLLLDASGKTLGRLASEIAKILRGKHKPIYTPHLPCGDAVIVVNVEKVVVTGNKEVQKEYVHYSGYPGGQKRIPYRQMKERHPDRILHHAVWGMLPHNRLGRQLIKRLRLFAGTSHNMAAQKPISINI